MAIIDAVSGAGLGRLLRHGEVEMGLLQRHPPELIPLRDKLARMLVERFHTASADSRSLAALCSCKSRWDGSPLAIEPRSYEYVRRPPVRGHHCCCCGGWVRFTLVRQWLLSRLSRCNLLSNCLAGVFPSLGFFQSTGLKERR